MTLLISFYNALMYAIVYVAAAAVLLWMAAAVLFLSVALLAATSRSLVKLPAVSKMSRVSRLLDRLDHLHDDGWMQQIWARWRGSTSSPVIPVERQRSAKWPRAK